MSRLLFAAEFPAAQSYVAAWVHLEGGGGGGGTVMKVISISLFTYFTLCVCLSVCLSVFLGGRGCLHIGIRFYLRTALQNRDTSNLHQ